MDVFDPRKFYNRKELKSKTGMTITKIRELEAANILPRVQLSERNIRYKGSTLNELFAEKFIND